MMRGFTLVEMIMVVAVLGILAAVSAMGWRARSPSADADILRQLADARAMAIRAGHPTVWRLDTLRIVFFADGSSSGGRVMNRGMRIDVDILTGLARAPR